MPEKISKDKTRLTVIEYQLSELDECGDIQDSCFYETVEDAIEAAHSSGDWSAVVVEKVVTRYPMPRNGDSPKTFTTIYAAGDKDALIAGGWIEKQEEKNVGREI